MWSGNDAKPTLDSTSASSSLISLWSCTAVASETRARYIIPGNVHRGLPSRSSFPSRSCVFVIVRPRADMCSVISEMSDDCWGSTYVVLGLEFLHDFLYIVRITLFLSVQFALLSLEGLLDVFFQHFHFLFHGQGFGLSARQVRQTCRSCSVSFIRSWFSDSTSLACCLAA